MLLPNVLRNAPKYWDPTVPLPAPPSSCQLMCYQPVRQCQVYWCWAAVLQELLRCLRGKYFPQCWIADFFLPIKDCCSHNAACDPEAQSPCNTTAALESLIAPLWRHQMTSAQKVSVEALCAAMQEDRPVIALFGQGTQSHYAVLSGITTVGGVHSLEVTDPNGGRRIRAPFERGRDFSYEGWSLSSVFFI